MILSIGKNRIPRPKTLPEAQKLHLPIQPRAVKMTPSGALLLLIQPFQPYPRYRSKFSKWKAGIGIFPKSLIGGLLSISKTLPFFRNAIPLTLAISLLPSKADINSGVISSPSPITTISISLNSERVWLGRADACGPPTIYLASGSFFLSLE